MHPQSPFDEAIRSRTNKRVAEACSLMFPPRARTRRHPPPFDEAHCLALDIARDVVRGCGVRERNVHPTRRLRKANQRDIRWQIAANLRPRGHTSTMILLALAQLVYDPATPVYIFVHHRDMREIARQLDRAVAGRLRNMTWYRTPRARGIQLIAFVGPDPDGYAATGRRLLLGRPRGEVFYDHGVFNR